MWNSRKDYMIWSLEWYVSASVTLMATGYACSLHGIPYIYVPLLTGICSALLDWSALLDIPLLIPAGYTIAHTGTCSALLDIPLLSLCSVLLDTDRLSPARHIRSALLPEIGPCSALLETTLQVLAQPCWTPLLSPAGNTIAQPYRCLLSPTGHRPLHSPAGHRPLLSPAGHRPLLSPAGLLDTGPCTALLDTLCPAGLCKGLCQALTQPCWTQPCWFAQP